jgi:hypothetical protein
LPTKFGQNLIVEKTLIIKFTGSFDADGQIWFEESISFSEIKMNCQETETVKATLISILHQGYLLNRNFITGSMGYNITTHLNFPKKMGTGTPSTLTILHSGCKLMLTLLNNSFGGSGYDIARKITATFIILKEANLSLTKFLSIQVQRKHLFCLS